MTRKINPKPLPISMIQKYAVDMVLKTFPEVEEPEEGFEVDALGTTMLLFSIDRTTEPLIDLEEKPGALIKNDSNYPYSDYFIISSFVEKKGFLIFCAMKECPVLDEHNTDSWYANMQIQFFHGGKTREECQRVVQSLESTILDQTFGRLFQDTFEHDPKMIPNAMETMLRKIAEMELQEKDIVNLITVLKNGLKDLGKELEKGRA
jgi:hypothetical protein